MDIREINQLTMEQEKKHFWIKTRFLYIDRVLRLIQSKEKAKIVEFGCGTGQNISYLMENSPLKNKIDSESLIGYDPELSLAPSSSSLNSHLVSDESRLNPPYNMGMALDVLEHIEDDAGTLKKWGTFLERESLLLITVPAFTFLWSHHDEFLGHKRRYTIESFEKIIPSSDFSVVECYYIFSYLFPVVLILRKLMSSKKGSDLAPVSWWINTILVLLGKLEFLLFKNRFIGTSLVIVLEKK